MDIVTSTFLTQTHVQRSSTNMYLFIYLQIFTGHTDPATYQFQHVKHVY